MTPSPAAERVGAVIDTPKIVYGALLFSWTFVTLMSAALIVLDGWMPGSILIAVPIIGILFSATGILRPKRIQLDRETLTYRPVWGRTLVIRKTVIVSFGVFVVHYHGSGFLVCNMQTEGLNWVRRENLGFLLMPDDLVRTLRRWLGRTP